MKIIISPAKTMKVIEEYSGNLTKPIFKDRADKIIDKIKKKSKVELKKILKCSDKLNELNYGRYSDMKSSAGTSPALLSYIGLQFQYISANVFSNEEWQYVNNHLCILSGLYGILRPSDAILPYRLEMQAILSIEDCDNLYCYWGSRIYDEISKDSNIIINLASKEYSKTLEPFLKGDVRMYNIVFAEFVDGKLKTKATPAKIARGEMVRYMAENKIEVVDGIKNFISSNGFVYNDEFSSNKELTFVKKD